MLYIDTRHQILHNFNSLPSYPLAFSSHPSPDTFSKVILIYRNISNIYYLYLFRFTYDHLTYHIDFNLYTGYSLIISLSLSLSLSLLNNSNTFTFLLDLEL